jgi:transposase
VHGARAVVRLVQRPSDPLRAFVGRIRERAHINVAISALANKIARVAWAVLRTERDFDAKYRRGAPSASPQPAA